MNVPASTWMAPHTATGFSDGSAIRSAVTGEPSSGACTNCAPNRMCVPALVVVPHSAGSPEQSPTIADAP